MDTNAIRTTETAVDDVFLNANDLLIFLLALKDKVQTEQERRLCAALVEKVTSLRKTGHVHHSH